MNYQIIGQKDIFIILVFNTLKGWLKIFFCTILNNT